MLELAAAFGVGVVLGAATGIPLGVLNVALVEAALRGGGRHASGIALGGAIADGTHALLAFAGIAPFLLDHEDLRRGLVIASAGIVLVYAIGVVLRPRFVPAATAEPAVRPGFGRGLATGIALTLPNPAPLLAWVAVAGAVLPRATLALAIAGALGVLLGSAIWFLGLARLAARGSLDGRAARLAPIVVAVLLVGVVGVALWRVF